MHFTTVLPLLAAALVFGAPHNKVVPRAIAFNPAASLGPLTAEQVLKAYPSTKTCVGAKWGLHECDTADVAAPRIELAYKKYNISSFGQKAALLSTMALESVDFKANINHSHNRTGQGTKAMLVFNYIYEYAKSFPELAPRVKELGPNISGLNYNTIDKVPGPVQSAIRDLVLGNDYTYGAAVWFLTSSSGCPKDTSAKLSAGGYSGFEYYITKCLMAGSTVDKDRKEKWCAAVKALAPSDMSPPAECT